MGELLITDHLLKAEELFSLVASNKYFCNHSTIRDPDEGHMLKHASHLIKFFPITLSVAGVSTSFSLVAGRLVV